eukprot:scaffold276768_cov33-Tisochrysis_lutea.AAC.1
MIHFAIQHHSTVRTRLRILRRHPALARQRARLDLEREAVFKSLQRAHGRDMITVLAAVVMSSRDGAL